MQCNKAHKIKTDSDQLLHVGQRAHALVHEQGSIAAIEN